MKALFLDIDGALNSGDPHPGYHSNPCHPDNVAQLARIIAATGARIVWSTSWRTGRHHSELDAFLAERGLIVESLGSTPRIPNAHRWREIRAWLDSRTDVTSYITIDDDQHAAVKASRHIQCWDTDGGLTEALADKAIRLLNEERR